MDMGGIAIAVWMWFFIVVPLLSLVNSVAIVGGMWAVLRTEPFPLRIVVLVFSVLLAGASIPFSENGYALAGADVGLLVIWIIARLYGFRIASRDYRLANRVGGIKRTEWQNGLRLILGFLVAGGCVIVAGIVCEVGDRVIAGMTETGVLLAVFLGIAYISMSISELRGWRVVILVFVTAWPMAVVSTDFSYGYVSAAVFRGLLPICFGGPLLAIILLATWWRGYRLVREKRPSEDPSAKTTGEYP